MKPLRVLLCIAAHALASPAENDAHDQLTARLVPVADRSTNDGVISGKAFAIERAREHGARERFIGKVECVERLEDKQRVARNVRAAVMRVYPVQRGLRPSDVRSCVLELDRQRLDELDLGQVVAVEDARQSNG